MKHFSFPTALFAFCAVFAAHSQLPTILTYQGRISAFGTNLSGGVGYFKFALVDAGTNLNRQATATATVSAGFLTEITVTEGGKGYADIPPVYFSDISGSNAVAFANVASGAVTSVSVADPGRNYSSAPKVIIAPPPPDLCCFKTFWSNDGTSNEGSEPQLPVPVLLEPNGFTVHLGDTSLSNMTVAIPPSVFTNSNVRLRIWFSEGGPDFQQLYPDQMLASAPYAMMAANVPDGAITAAHLAPDAVGNSAVGSNAVANANIADGAVTTSKLADGAVTSDKLAIGAGVGGVPSRMAVFTSSGTWIRPEGVSRIHVKMWGGGGGGYLSSLGAFFSGGGGGYCEGILNVAGNVNVSVGQGGAGAAWPATGLTGGSSSLLSLAAAGGEGASAQGHGLGGIASGGQLNVRGFGGARGGASPMGGGTGNGAFPGAGGLGTGAGSQGLVVIYY